VITCQLESVPSRGRSLEVSRHNSAKLVCVVGQTLERCDDVLAVHVVRASLKAANVDI
jgi:hypothetical protein